MIVEKPRRVFGSRNFTTSEWRELYTLFYTTGRAPCPTCRRPLRFDLAELVDPPGYHFHVRARPRGRAADEGPRVRLPDEFHDHTVQVWCPCGCVALLGRCVDPAFRQFRRWTDDECLAIVAAFAPTGSRLGLLCPIDHSPLRIVHDADERPRAAACLRCGEGCAL